MLLYNITIIIEEKEAQHWKEWMTKTHIPQLITNTKFESHKFYEILDSPNEGLSYSIQLLADNESQLAHFRDNFEQDFIAQMYANYPNKLLAFSTLMKHI